MKEFTINQTYFKVLLTVSILNKQSLYPLNEGLFKILTGIMDDETASLTELPTFATLTSYSSKRICHLTLMLFRHGLIGKIYDPVSKKLFLRTTERGEKALEDFTKNHHRSFNKRKKKNVMTIAKIV